MAQAQPHVQFNLPPSAPSSTPPSIMPQGSLPFMQGGGGGGFQPPTLNQLGLGSILPGNRTPADPEPNFLAKISLTGANVFSDLGLTHPVQRFAAGMLLGGVLEYFIRPGISYNENGSPKNWAVLSGQSGQGETYLPAGSTAFITGLVFATFF